MYDTNIFQCKNNQNELHCGHHKQQMMKNQLLLHYSRLRKQNACIRRGKNCWKLQLQRFLSAALYPSSISRLSKSDGHDKKVAISNMNGIVVSWIQVSAVTWVQPNPIPTDLVGLGLVTNRVQVRLGLRNQVLNMKNLESSISDVTNQMGNPCFLWFWVLTQTTNMMDLNSLCWQFGTKEDTSLGDGNHPNKLSSSYRNKWCTLHFYEI